MGTYLFWMGIYQRRPLGHCHCAYLPLLSSRWKAKRPNPLCQIPKSPYPIPKKHICFRRKVELGVSFLPYENVSESTGIADWREVEPFWGIFPLQHRRTETLEGEHFSCNFLVKNETTAYGKLPRKQNELTYRGARKWNSFLVKKSASAASFWRSNGFRSKTLLLLLLLQKVFFFRRN